MLEIKASRCQACGQGWLLNKCDEYNLTAPQFCPCCGTPTLTRDTNALGADAACFSGMHPKLTQLMYQQWRLNPDHEDPPPMQRHPRFIDYMHSELAS